MQRPDKVRTGSQHDLDLITAQDTLRQTRNSYYTAIGSYRRAAMRRSEALSGSQSKRNISEFREGASLPTLLDFSWLILIGCLLQIR